MQQHILMLQSIFFGSTDWECSTACKEQPPMHLQQWCNCLCWDLPKAAGKLTQGTTLTCSGGQQRCERDVLARQGWSGLQLGLMPGLGAEQSTCRALKCAFVRRLDDMCQLTDPQKIIFA
jgi:hypothetical protein